MEADIALATYIFGVLMIGCALGMILSAMFPEIRHMIRNTLITAWEVCKWMWKLWKGDKR